MVLLTFKYRVLVVVVFAVLFICMGKCQEDDEDEDEYDEETADQDPTTAEPTTRRYRVRGSNTTAPYPLSAGRNESLPRGNSTASPLSAGAGTTLASNAAGAGGTGTPPPLPPTRSPTRATTLSESEEEETTEEEGYGFVFRPLTNLFNNVVAGNVTGIVDNALSIRTPPEVRLFVNNVMQNVFGVGAGFGGALKQFAPSFFSTQAPPLTGTERDPIPADASAPVHSQITVPGPIAVATPVVIHESAIIEARGNETEELNTKTKKHAPLQLKFTHPGAPASRLRCEIVKE